MSSKVKISDFFSVYLIPAISLGGALCLLFSISYHFGFFSAIKLDLLGWFSLADYIASGIAFVLPAVLYIVFLESCSAISKKQKKRRSFLKIKRTIMLLIAFSAICLLWYFFYFPNIGILIISLLLFPLGAMSSKLLFRSSLPFSQSLSELFFSILVASHLCLMFGYINGSSLLEKEENVTLLYVENKEKVQKKIVAVRSLEKVFIYLEQGKIRVLNQDNIILVSSGIKQKPLDIRDVF